MFLDIYSRLMPIVNLLYIAKQHTSFPLQLVWRLWSGKLWKESLQRNILKLFYQKAMEFDFNTWFSLSRNCMQDFRRT